MNAIRYQLGYKYQLYETYLHRLINPVEIKKEIKSRFLDLSTDGILTIKQGYASDGPSGISLDTKTFMRGAFVHDALYQLMREGLIARDQKDAADKELRDICIQDGMMKARAWYVYHAVKMFGRSSTIHNKQVFIAP